MEILLVHGNLGLFFVVQFSLMSLPFLHLYLLAAGK